MNMLDIDKKIKSILNNGVNSKAITLKKPFAMRKPKTSSQFSFGNNINKMLGKKLNFPLLSKGKTKRDWDGDGIPNFKDCQPRNIMRQDSKLNKLQQERFNKIGTFQSTLPGDEEYDLPEKESKRKYRIIRSVFKKNPDLFSIYENKEIGILPDKYKNLKYVKNISGSTFDDIDNKKIVLNHDFFSKSGNLSRAATLFHEAQHLKQIEENRFGSPTKQIPSKEKNYYEDPLEYEAEAEANKKILKRLYSNTPEEERNIYANKIVYKKAFRSPEQEKELIENRNLLIKQEKQNKQQNIQAGLQCIGAPIQKQNEWKNMPEQERNQQRQIKPDADGDRVPDEYDCQPSNIMRQDKYYHGTPSMFVPEILDEGIKPSQELPESHRMSEKTDSSKTYVFKEPKHAMTWARVVTNRVGMGKPKVLEVDLEPKKLERDFNMPFGESYSHKGNIEARKVKVYKGDTSYNLRTQKGAEDKDGDGVMNLMDCEPQNKHKQDFALDEERYNFKEQRLSHPKYGRKIVMMPTEELYHKRAKYNIQDTEYLYEDSYEAMKNAKEQYLRERKIPEEKKYLVSDDDVMNFRFEKKKKILEQRGYKVYPPKIIKKDYGAVDKYKIKYRYTPKKYDERVEEIMSPQNWGDDSSKRFDDLTKSGISKEKAGQIVKDEYYDKMRKDVKSKKPIVQMVSLYGDDVSKSKTMGEGRHRVLAAKAAGMKEMPVFIEPNNRLPEGALDKYRELSNEEIKKYVPTKKEEKKEINNLMNDDDNDGVNNMMDCDPNDKFKQGPGDYDINYIMQKYEQNPRGDWQGECHNAVQELARYFQNNGIESNRMKVYQIQTVGPDGLPSNHVVLKVDNTFYDPTGTQYAHIHGGQHQSIRTSLPLYYKVHKIIGVEQYL